MSRSTFLYFLRSSLPITNQTEQIRNFFGNMLILIWPNLHWSDILIHKIYTNYIFDCHCSLQKKHKNKS